MKIERISFISQRNSKMVNNYNSNENVTINMKVNFEKKKIN